MAVKKVQLNSQAFEINYEILNPKNKKDLIILHGWGSNKEIMKQAFSKILPQFRHIYIDLPGFGKSDNDYILNTQSYAYIMEEFLKKINAQKDIIMGHSFGGKVATLLKPELLILLSNSGIPIPKPFSIRFKIKLFKILKNIGGSALSKAFASKDVEGMSQNMYETFKIVVNEDFSDIFASHEGNTLIFWGKEDSATPLWSGEKVAELIQNSTFYPLKGDHFFFLKYSIFIEKVVNGKL
ncbi:MAG TPA: alpha/beta hydrolase [Campylobacterales bacterium]|nr:alpha/beta hydrolase [Campylobacterales bacterium]HIP60498.1 alpha/beta hydrolase [Campylobacterales bacterium]